MPLDIAVIGADHRRVAKREIVLPTLPSFAAVAGGDRATLLAGLTFVEAASSGWAADDLVQWFRANLALLGWPGPPPTVTESPVGTLSLRPGARLVGDRFAPADDLPKLLAMTRWKVAVTLRGLLSNDDGFLNGAIFAGRVRRDAKASEWLARPRASEPLSDIVLSLFVADILAYREFHVLSLCVCHACGRISYNPQGTSRTGCADHLPGSAPLSAARLRAPLEDAPPIATAAQRKR